MNDVERAALSAVMDALELILTAMDIRPRYIADDATKRLIRARAALETERLQRLRDGHQETFPD